MEKINVGIIGCGTIGSEIGKAITSSVIPGMELIAICEEQEKNLNTFNKSANTNFTSLSISNVISCVDFVVEAASSKISFEIAKETLSYGKNVMILSVGGLLKGIPEILKLSSEKGGKLFIPSGAICGLDGLKAGSVNSIYSVTLITTKPPLSFSDAPFIKQNKINLENILKETCIFDGTAYDAVSAFPKNINVALTLSLAGIGPKKTKVKIIADPNCKLNTHEIYVEGNFGKFYTKTENKPSPNNPKTSFMAGLSAISMLKNITSPMIIGS